MKDEILNSWEVNAKEWIHTIDNEGILSRKVTNEAIINTVLKYNPESVCDVGCGEGWLTRKLIKKGIDTTGIDGTEALIKSAQVKNIGEFKYLTYEEIIKNNGLGNQSFEAILFNFSLYQKEATEQLFLVIQNSLKEKSLIFIQTLHSFNLIQGDFAYQNQWIENAWKDLQGNFKQPHSWYFRTVSGWLSLFKRVNLEVLEVQEPLFPDSLKPASLIFVLTPKK